MAYPGLLDGVHISTARSFVPDDYRRSVNYLANAVEASSRSYNNVTDVTVIEISERPHASSTVARAEIGTELIHLINTLTF